MTTQTPESDTNTASRPGLFWALVLGALVLGAGMRLYGLNDASLWIDELYTVRDACDIFEPGRRPTRWLGYVPTAIVLGATGMDAPTITWDNLATWKEAGLQPWHIRLGPALIGIFSIPILAFAVRRAVRDDFVAGLFAVLLAFAPWHVYWSQLGRYYTLKFLFLGLAFAWYYRGTRQQDKRFVVLACLMLFLAYLVHPIALALGLIFMLDIAVSYLRKQPIRIGKAGWITAIATGVVGGAILVLEKKLWPAAFEPFVGQEQVLGQSPAMIFAGAFYMIQMPVLICSLAAVVAMRRRGDREQGGAYWMLVALVPIVVIAALSTETFSKARYAFDALFGFLVLASVGSAIAWRALQPQFGRFFAALPCLLILAANLLFVVQHHTTGHHLHRDYVSVFEYIQKHRKPGEKVFCQRPEIATYYLGEDLPDQPPTRRFRVDKLADGSPVWVVVLGASSVKTHPWSQAEHAELRGVYPTRVWQPYAELHVYRYLPRAREIWEAEERAFNVENGG